MFYTISEVLLNSNPGIEFERDVRGGGKEKIKVGDYMQ